LTWDLTRASEAGFVRMLELGTTEQTFVRGRWMNELPPVNMDWSP